MFHAMMFFAFIIVAIMMSTVSATGAEDAPMPSDHESSGTCQDRIPRFKVCDSSHLLSLREFGTLKEAVSLYEREHSTYLGECEASSPRMAVAVLSEVRICLSEVVTR